MGAIAAASRQMTGLDRLGQVGRTVNRLTDNNFEHDGDEASVRTTGCLSILAVAIGPPLHAQLRIARRDRGPRDTHRRAWATDAVGRV